MRLSIFDENDRILILGEGNFSFSAALCKHNLKILAIATCYETVPINDTAVANIAYLKSNGVSVLVGVDATKLLENDELNELRFNKILFNFPHVCSKMRLDKNRTLLQKFFECVGKMLASDGKVLVTLCNGQGGTNYDRPQRKWNDSWKIKEMAAHGNFILEAVEPFIMEHFSNYTRTGYRGIDKQFNVEQAFVHVLVAFGTLVQRHFTPVLQISLPENDRPGSQWRDIIPFKIQEETFGPPIFILDITFYCSSDFKQNIFYVVLFNHAGNIIKNVEFLRSYRFPDSEKITRTYRISYQSDMLPLHRRRIIEIHENTIPQILECNLDVKVPKQQSIK